MHCCDLTEIPEILRRFSPPLASKGNFEGFPSKTNNWILIKLHVSTTCNKSRSSYDVSSCLVVASVGLNYVAAIIILKRLFFYE